MGSLNLFVYAFYALNVGATLFFLHKVLWLYRYKRLQNALVDEATRQLRARHLRQAEAFEAFAAGLWSEVGDPSARSLGAYVARTLSGLRDARRQLRAGRGPILPLLVEAAAHKTERAAAGTALVVPSITGGEGRHVRWEVEIPALAPIRPLDPQLYALQTTSRYTFFRRALVFFAGVADVIYSAQHVAVMSQNPNTPRGVILRRLSLVVLLVTMIAADLLFGIRVWVSAQIGARWRAPDLTFLGDLGKILMENFATIAGVIVWTVAISLVYFIAAMAIRRRSRLFQKRLARMREEEAESLRTIAAEHRRELDAWLRAYGESLDDAVDLAARQAELMIEYARGKLYWRIVGAALVDTAKRMAAVLLAELPEASGALADRATGTQRTWRHHLWPREEEMHIEVALAQVRSAWQDIESCLQRLAHARPDPEAIDHLGRQLALYAAAFSETLPDGAAEEVRESHRAMVTQIVEGCRDDLGDLEKQLADLTERLRGELGLAGPLVRFQADMTNHRLQTKVARLTSDVLATRERARLETMAFEI